MATTYTQPKKRNTWRYLVFAGIIIVLLVVAGLTWHHYHGVKPKTVNLGAGTATANPNVPGSDAQNNNPKSNSIPESKDNDANQPGTPPSSSVQPSQPEGVFVSNHNPSLSGSSYSNVESSTCSTTAGVTCQVRFTSVSSGKVLELPAQRTAAAGSTEWDWKLQDIGLTAGTWKVAAVATNGSKTASIDDPMRLVVSP